LYSDDLPLPKDIKKIEAVIFDGQTRPLLLQSHGPREYHPKVQGRKLVGDIKPQTEKPHAAPVQPTVKAAGTELSWYYLDNKGERQGPFGSSRLRGWWDNKKLPRDIALSNSGKEGSFRPVYEYFPDLSLAFSYNPLGFPFLGPPKPDKDDPLHQIFSDFEAKLLKV
jgi:hypothetical protein